MHKKEKKLKGHFAMNGILGKCEVCNSQLVWGKPHECSGNTRYPYCKKCDKEYAILI